MPAWRPAVLVCLALCLAAPVQRASGDFGDGLNVEDRLKEGFALKQRRDYFTTTTKRPGTTRAPAKPEDDFNLADALDDRNDRDDGLRKPSAGGGGITDQDLEDILGDYKPDKGKGDGRYDSNDGSESGMSAETGTIAGVASALAMALVGAISSYVSYQQKKFCFSIQHAAEGQEGLSADYVRGENLEAVVCEEPQVTYMALPSQAAQPPAESSHI
ncbi:CD99 antigen-like protein 2 isoform X2 [Talpa occidentalis]|uniref:CD99 antigen-like protein 2 isoform X2 n=1 Tax=Talpa occidentalis TaxID=50954 RepID=UPI00188E0BA2|nr:CD99 antigen-like protein 2 isoform X2 [Talpa occidentalis]